MTPEDWASLKLASGVIGTGAGAAWAAWLARGRKEKQNGGNGNGNGGGEDRGSHIYAGPPDDRPRNISSKEWHDLNGTVNTNGLKLYNLEAEVKNIAKAVQRMEEHEVWDNFGRLDERVASHHREWLEAGERARLERGEVMTALAAISAQLGDLYRRLASMASGNKAGE